MFYPSAVRPSVDDFYNAPPVVGLRLLPKQDWRPDYKPTYELADQPTTEGVIRQALKAGWKTVYVGGLDEGSRKLFVCPACQALAKEIAK
jgi:hypothetical protein